MFQNLFIISIPIIFLIILLLIFTLIEGPGPLNKSFEILTEGLKKLTKSLFVSIKGTNALANTF